MELLGRIFFGFFAAFSAQLTVELLDRIFFGFFAAFSAPIRAWGSYNSNFVSVTPSESTQFDGHTSFVGTSHPVNESDLTVTHVLRGVE